MVTLTVTFSEAVTVSGGTPNLVLNDGGTATYSSGSGSTALVFSHTVQAGQNVADLAVTSLSLNGATVKDTAGNLANTVAAAGYNPAGMLRIDTTVPTVSSIAASGPALTAGGGTVGAGATVIFTVAMSEAVSVTGTPSLSLSSGGKATYAGGSGSGSLVFTHTVAAGQSAADLTVTAFNLEGGTVSDVAGNAASLSGATNYNPAGTLKVDTSTPSVPPPASVTQPSSLVTAVNVGGGQVTASNGVVFQADAGPTTGGAASQVFSTTAGIAGTTDDALYQNERWTAGGSYTYEIAVANGTYQVDLLLAEIYSGIFAPGQRVFDMSLEGQALAALQNIDVYAQVGANTAYTISQQVTVSDGSLSIQVGPGSSSPGNVENAKLNAFAVYTAAAAPPPSPTLSIAAANASQNEGNSGSTPFTFTVTRTGSTAAASTAAFAVTGSGANPAVAADFAGGVLPTGTVSFAAGEATKTITVNVAGDSTVESAENFTVTLSNPSAGTAIGTAAATGTILNDDSTHHRPAAHRLHLDIDGQWEGNIERHERCRRQDLDLRRRDLAGRCHDGHQRHVDLHRQRRVRCGAQLRNQCHEPHRQDERGDWTRPARQQWRRYADRRRRQRRHRWRTGQRHADRQWRRRHLRLHVGGQRRRRSRRRLRVRHRQTRLRAICVQRSRARRAVDRRVRAGCSGAHVRAAHHPQPGYRPGVVRR